MLAGEAGCAGEGCIGSERSEDEHPISAKTQSPVIVEVTSIPKLLNFIAN